MCGKNSELTRGVVFSCSLLADLVNSQRFAPARERTQVDSDVFRIAQLTRKKESAMSGKQVL
jgi:hypothetical protein